MEITRRKTIKRFYIINQYIKAAQIRVIGEQGEQLGVMSKDEALFRARQKGLDLVEVASNAIPPVCKIIDFKKFRYQEDKKERAGKKKGISQETKEIRFTPFIAQNDFEIRMNRTKEFLSEGHKVKLTVKFVGRQLTHKEFGYELIKRAMDKLQEVAKPESEPKWLGKILIQIIKPIKK